MATAAVLAFGSASAFAQDEPASSPPTETSTAPPPAPSNEPQALKATGDVSGVVYADKNRNGQRDPDEAIADSTVTIFGGGDSSEHKTTSGPDGTFVFRDLAPGTYHPAYRLAGGWVVHHTKVGGDLITVTANQTTEVVARAERPYDEQFQVTAALDRDSYRHPASATVTLTFTNTTDRAIDGIQAACDRELSAQSLGRGDGLKVVKGNGLRLAAGEKRTVTIVEEIPSAARETGSVRLDCDFAPRVGWNIDGTRVHAEAAVTGGTGGHTVVLGDDRNSNGRIDPEEVISGAKVVLLNPRTGEQVAEVTSGKDGKVEFTGLPVGDHRAVLLGGYGFRDAGQEQVRITEQGGFGYWFLKHVRSANIRVTAKFEKPRYESHETVRLDMTITNTGGTTAERVRLVSDGHDVTIPREQWGDLASDGPGLRIAAGESRTITLSGKINAFAGGELTFWGVVDYLGRPNPGNSGGYHATVEVVLTTGDINGVVYVDRNRNGQQDAGEAAADVVVEANGGAPYGYLKATTDANGRFSFDSVPTGGYLVSYTLADGWIVRTESAEPHVHVLPGATVGLTGRAERPYRETLKATAVLDKATYAVGEDAKTTISLTNKSDRQMSGIQAACNRNGDPHDVGGAPDDVPSTGWGDLKGRGITLAPGETKTFLINAKVPASARNKRKVVIRCDFEPNPDYNNDGPEAFDWASVPGGFGELEGELFHDRNGNWRVDDGEAIPNTRILMLTDKENGFTVAETLSDARGKVRFEQVPPGEYWLRIDGPWKFQGEYGGHVQILDEGVAQVQLGVVPGPAPDPAPGEGDQGAGDDNSGDTGTGGALAKTGASVLGLGVVAALLIAFGIGARAAGRRRSP